MTYQLVNPANGVAEKAYPDFTDAQVQDALERATAGYAAWRATDLGERVALLRRVAELHEERIDMLTVNMAREMGKPVSSGRGEVGIVAAIYRYYADNAESLLADQPVNSGDGVRSYVALRPIGPILGVMPWNYPLYQAARLAAPNLLLGNAILLKHAGQCPESARAMEQIFTDAGLVDGAYINLFATTSQIADMIADDRVAGVSLTGSERAGASVGAEAGKALKKVVLELGGSDPFIVVDVPDWDHLIKEAIVGRFGNCGQACNASKRFFIPADLHDEFVERFSKAVGEMVLGDPMKPDTTMGPLSSVAARTEIAAQVDDALGKGAVATVGGHVIEGPGAYYAPTVLTGVTEDMRAYREEIFGPVAVVHKVDSVEEAIEKANDSEFGLAASVYGSDVDACLEVANQLECGMVHINESPATAPELPFGGVKKSGFGRELGTFGVNEFANHKLFRVLNG